MMPTMPTGLFTLWEYVVMVHEEMNVNTLMPWDDLLELASALHRHKFTWIVSV